MPKLAYKPQQSDNYNSQVVYDLPQRYVKKSLQPYKKKPKNNKTLQRVISIIFVSLIAYFVLPLGFQRFTLSFMNGSRYPEIKTDLHKLLYPTSDYLANDLIDNQRYLTRVVTKKPEMIKMSETYELTDLEHNLNYLASQYPSIKPSVYVWQYGTEKFADVKASEIYSAASIIKVPVLIELFKSIESGQLNLNDKMILTDYYRAEGSGSLQFKEENSIWTIDDLARLMITESDNSATNMLIAKLGSTTNINDAIRRWGLKQTQVKTWLPDITGNNYTSARDMATMFYNIDNNPDFLTLKSKEKIFNYMSHVHNDRLIPAGLGPGALFMHKTGDIGKMLGDAGIVFAPNGTKYIVVILANRPHNSVQGKEFIVKASSLIYDYMVK